MNLVVVTWLDAREGRGPAVAKLQERRSVGWLFCDTKEIVGLVHEADVETGEDTYFTVIPAPQVVEMHEIELEGGEP